MTSTFSVVLPLFTLILVGYGARRTGVLGPHATRELNRMVVHLALPALLFDLLARADWGDIWQPKFVAAFGLSAVAVFGLSSLVWMSQRRRLADAAIASLNASYSNTGFLGLPLVLAALGRDAVPSAVVATILLVVLMAMAMALVELDVQGGEARPGRLLIKTTGSVLRSPLILAPVLGACVSGFGWQMPEPGMRFVGALGAAAAPCALLTLGLFLAEPAETERVAVRPVAFLVGLKLLAQPLLAWGLAWSLGLPPQLTCAAVLLAALPTGTGPFMLATHYDREKPITSNVAVISTVASVVTVSAFLALKF